MKVYYVAAAKVLDGCTLLQVAMPFQTKALAAKKARKINEHWDSFRAAVIEADVEVEDPRRVYFNYEEWVARDDV